MKLIEKELEKSKVPQHELKEVKLLLDTCHQEDINILKGLSKNSELNILERNVGKRVNLEKLDKDWNGNIYHKDEIKNLCIKYRLRLLSSQYYKGKFDVETVKKLKDFSKENNISLDNYCLREKFFIMAPPEMFSLQEAKYVTKKQLDPVLFYKVDEDNYKKIHAWGTDFTVLRRIIGWKWENAFNEFLFNMGMSLSILNVLCSFLFPNTEYNHYIFMNIVILIASITLSVIMAHTDEFEQVDEFFTPYNWNETRKLK